MKKKETDLDRFKQMIKNQSPAGVRDDDWTKLTIELQKATNGDTDIKIAAVRVGFCFSRRGRLKGIFNYKGYPVYPSNADG